MQDSEIIEYIFSKNGKIIRHRLDTMSQEMKDYITNRYNDSNSIQESIYRIKYNIETRPVCTVCGGHVSFYGRTNRLYYNTCSLSCSAKLTMLRSKDDRIRKYGSFNNCNKGVETRKQSDKPYKDEQKCKETCLERYGNENYRNVEKSKETCLERYKSEYYLTSANCKEKTIQKFGTDNYRKTAECKQKVSKYHTDHKDELNAKRKQTCINKYGVENYTQSADYVKLVHNEDFQKHRRQQEYITKKNNNSFNTSHIENTSYNMLKEKYHDVISQYKSEKYPFNCDFYVPSLDLYIECNYHWTHGGHPYNKETDKHKLEEWKNKNTIYYNNAIKTWTVRDVTKRNIAKQNNLNYIEFWTINDLQNWLNKQ